MLGLHVYLGRQRSKRLEIPKLRVTFGSDASNGLVLRDGGALPFHGVLVCVDDRWVLAAPGAPHPPDGARPLEDGAHIEAGDYTLVLALAGPPRAPSARAAGTPAQPLPLARDPVEQRLLDAIAGGDEASRLVYADWLEDRGDVLLAEFLRLQRSLADVEPTDPADRDRLQEGRARLRVLASQIDLDWRRHVGRPVVEGCRQVTLDFQCKMDWGALAPTERPGVRYCHGCGDHVYYAITLADAREHARFGHCIVVDFTQTRWPDDLRPPPAPPRPGVPSMPNR